VCLQQVSAPLRARPFIAHRSSSSSSSEARTGWTCEAACVGGPLEPAPGDAGTVTSRRGGRRRRSRGSCGRSRGGQPRHGQRRATRGRGVAAPQRTGPLRCTCRLGGLGTCHPYCAHTGQRRPCNGSGSSRQRRRRGLQPQALPLRSPSSSGWCDGWHQGGGGRGGGRGGLAEGGAVHAAADAGSSSSSSPCRLQALQAAGPPLR